MFSAALKLDGPTLVNLELLESSLGGPVGSLLACLDSCVTPGETALRCFCLMQSCLYLAADSIPKKCPKDSSLTTECLTTTWRMQGGDVYCGGGCAGHSRTLMPSRLAWTLLRPSKMIQTSHDSCETACR